MSVKVVFNQDIRRVKVDFNGPNPFRQLTQALCEAFNLADNTKFVLKYQDDEDEMITISSSTELVEAERIASQEARKNLKVFVFVDGAAPPAHVGDDISIASDESFVVTASAPVSRQASKTASVDVPRAAPAPEAAEEEVKVPEPTPTPTPVADDAPAPETKTESPVEPELPCWRELLPEFRDFIRDPKIHEALRPLLPAIFDSVTSGQATPSSFADLLLQAPAIKNHPLVQKLLPFLPRALECLNNLKQHVGAWMQQVASLIESMCVGVQGDQEFRFDIPMWLPQHFQHMFAPQASRAPSASSSSSSGPKPVHRSVECDGCRMYPVVGARFKCTVCDDFDLCENCETRAVHPPDHPLLKIYRPAIETDEQGRFIHRGYRCDGCDVAPIVGNRYNCTVCRNFDLCDECEAKSQHPVDHPLLKIKEPKAPQGMCGRRSDLGRMLRAMRALAVPTPAENAPAAAAPVKEAKVKRARRCVRRREARAEPHVTFEASVQPQVSTTADAAFVKDHSIPDKSFCLPSVTLRKVWIMRNSGDAQWPQGTSLAYLSGSVLPVEGASFLAPVDLAQPGEEVAVTVDVITPAKPGHHFGYFTLQTADGVRFGHRVWVEVNVTASGKTSTGQDVATPAPATTPVPVAVQAAEEVKVEDVKVDEPAAPASSTPEAAAEVKAEEPKVEAAPAPVVVAAPEVKAEEPVVAAPAPAPSAPVLEVPVVRPVSPVDDFVHVPRVQFSLPPNFDHGAQLQYLLGMGFTDRQRLINLLNAHGGNLEVVINRLL